MKQIEIYIDPSLNLETQKMVEMYFAVKTVGSIEGFVYSEEEFLKRYKNTYMINDFRTARYYAIYKVNHCTNCRQSYEVIISNRQELVHFLQKPYSLCNTCIIFQASTENILGFRLK